MTAKTIAELAALAANTEDQTETTSSGDFDFIPPAAGVTVGRFIEYVEIGNQPQNPWQGKAKPPHAEVRLVFELTAPKNIKTIEEGERKGEKFAERIAIKVTKKLGDRAKFHKIFVAMQYGRDNVKHMAQMLGEAFIINITHNTVTKPGEKDRTYANIEKDGAIGISAPYQVDALAGTRTAVNVPAALSPLKLFLFDHPTKETWDSLFIDGTRNGKDAQGKEVQVSKNWLQEKILSAVNYKGSMLDGLLSGVNDLPITEGNPAVEIGMETLPATQKPASAGAGADALAALGLSA